jgi:transcriptional regulator of heat shock response
MTDSWEDNDNMTILNQVNPDDASLASNVKRLDPLSQRLWKQKQDELRKSTEISASCHQSPANETLQEINEDIATVIKESMPPPRTKVYNMKLVFSKDQSSQKRVTKFITKMMDTDDNFMITVFDYSKSEENLRLLIAVDIPTKKSVFNHYMVPIWDKKNKEGSMIVMQVTTIYSHVQWKHIMEPEVKSRKIQIRLHNLESLETKAIRFFLRRHTWEDSLQ